MHNTAPKLTGMIVVAAMFGFLFAGVSHVVLGHQNAGALLTGFGVFALVFVVLALGWREPQGKANQHSD